ncbi:MAG: AMP-binding protein [Anaerolineales bacterium]|nr:AMP-binding protein [Anaerolineales bacterium]
MALDTIPHRLMENGRVRPNAPAYFVKSDGEWIPTSWGEYVAQVRQAAAALIALDLKPVGGVCILGFNRPEWVIFDLASMVAGGYASGIYASNAPHEVQYVIENSESSILLLENEEQWQKVHEVRDQVPGLKHVIAMKGCHIDDPLVLDWETFMKMGNQIGQELVEERLAGIKKDQLAALIYTSGTTGPPKGAMLSHHNLAWTAAQGIRLFDITSEDSMISYLPLSHAAEQMFTIHAAVTGGYQVYYAQYPPQKHLSDNLKEVSPTFMFGVPRVWERFAEGIKGTLAKGSRSQARIAKWALRVGKRVSAVKNEGGEPTGRLARQYRLANRFVYSKVKEALGLSRARYCITGAAPIATEIVEFFNCLDFPLLEIYGQTEVSGPTSINRPGANKIGSVGQAWPGVQIRLAEDGEILVKGPNVFMGYYRNPEATASDLVDDWLRTGDLGELDEQGFLTVIGRKKEIIITSGGLNIAPNNIEAELMKLPLVSQAICIGEKRRFITCLLTLDKKALTKFAAEHALEGDDLHANPVVIAAVKKGIDEQVNPQFARAEQVRDFRILPRDFTIEDGELTPTLKIKRRVVNERFRAEIEDMYAAK